MKSFYLLQIMEARQSLKCEIWSKKTATSQAYWTVWKPVRGPCIFALAASKI